MKYNVLAVTLDNLKGTEIMIYKGITGCIPNKGDEIEVNGDVFLVEKVRHIIREGSYNTNDVKLLLKYIGRQKSVNYF